MHALYVGSFSQTSPNYQTIMLVRPLQVLYTGINIVSRSDIVGGIGLVSVAT